MILIRLQDAVTVLDHAPILASMKEFNTIREAARKKRDLAIKKARDEYAATLLRIAELEQDLLGRDPSTHKTIVSCIERAIPSSRTFTTADILADLEAIDGGRVWRKRSVGNHLSRLRHRGLVKHGARRVRSCGPPAVLKG